MTPEEHLSWILERVAPTPEIECDLRAPEALGATVSRDVRARYDLPLWDNSAMDGYAVRAADVAGASTETPRVLRVVGEVAAGSAEDPRIEPGAAVRIMTGAPLPGDADAVVPVERTRVDGARDPSGAAAGRSGGDPHPWAESSVAVLAAAPRGANVRRRGEDVPAGTVLALPGQELTAARIAALAAAGVQRVSVHRPPRVAVLTTGSELRTGDGPLVRGQIPESNSLLIAGLLRESGVAAVETVRCPDDVAALRERLDDLARRCDAVVTTGGIGPGRHDIVRVALADEPGVRQVAVAVRPGRPQGAGRLSGGALLLALPGNPVSAAVGFELFVRPAILAMQGRERLQRTRVRAIAAAAWRGAPGRLQVLPVRVFEDPELRCAPVVDPRGVSHAVGGHGAADGYALVDAERGDVAAGETVTVMLVTR
ncbi:molybdopterin molybdotransferase MoeA [Leucobacter chromiisoli]|uniref:molybdopterin molybdotransferase MoeA n=1 Tax=Leucobacter chromiisoli TaxID=2796471 RepID=UPI0027DE445C|nr:gephyrin-like molybdotransferase Glp [Leucobacter chromiisoli]